MALSGTDDFNLTRDEIIRAAFETIGVAVTNEPLDPDDVRVGQIALNVLAMSYKAYGLQLWKRGRYTLNDATTPALTAGTAAYEFGGAAGDFLLKPMRILEAERVTDSDNISIPLTRLSLEEYDALPDKTQQGTPLNFYFEPGRLTSKMYLWPTPDATWAAANHIDIIYQAAMEDMDVGTEEVDFPNEWYRALILNLAVDLAPKYGLEMRERQMLEIQAADALDLAKDYDVEDTSVFLQPNMRGY